jgi:23S rRNA (cytosine1962-C5)-methyltransferase
MEGEASSGATVDVFSHDHQWLARAAYSPESQIRGRVWTWQPDEAIDPGFFKRRLIKAWNLRQDLLELAETDAYRVVHAESDGLPGIILDRYGDWAVLQLLTAGAERWRQTLLEIIKEQGWFSAVYERSDTEVRALEGLNQRAGLLYGEGKPEEVVIREGSLRFHVNLAQGQKTGFYLDQRQSRSLVAQRAAGVHALDAFCYSGAFTLALLAGGAAQVTSIDSSDQAIAELETNLNLNAFSLDQVERRQADVFQDLRQLRDEGRQFDLIVLDPPKFAPTRQQAQSAARGYKDINLYAFKLLKPGGELFTFSCSGGVEPELFQKIVAGAAVDAQREAIIVRWLDQATDHPVSLAFPEGRYLKGLHCRVG